MFSEKVFLSYKNILFDQNGGLETVGSYAETCSM